MSCCTNELSNNNITTTNIDIKNTPQSQRWCVVRIRASRMVSPATTKEVTEKEHKIYNALDSLSGKSNA